MLPETDKSQPAHRRSRRQEESASSWPGNALAWALLALPIVVFGVIWQYYAINIPKWDDHTLRFFLYKTDQEPTLSGKIYQLFKQHNEHRIVYDRVVSLLDYQLVGKLNYVHLMAIGNLSLVGLLAVFVAVLRRAGTGRGGQSVLYAVPVALLLFNLSQWENMFWGMASLQNFSVVLWVIAAFYFLSYTNRWGLAFAMGVLATLTSGNGLMVWPIGFALLALRLTPSPSGNNKKIYRPLVGWLVGAAVVIGLYFIGFEKPGGIAYVRPDAIDLLKSWFAVVGAAAEVLPMGSPLRSSMLIGGVMVLITVGIIGLGLWNNRLIISQQIRALLAPKATVANVGKSIPSITLFFWGCAGFILGTAAVVAWARTGFGIDLLITSRYKMYSLTGLALLYVYITVTLPNRLSRIWVVGSVVGGLIFAGLSYGSFLDETIWWRHWMTTNQFNLTHTTNQPVATSDPISYRYTPPTPAFYDTILPVIYGPARQPTLPVQVSQTPDGFSVQSANAPVQGLGDSGNYLLARSAKRTYLFPVWQNQQSIRAAGVNPKQSFIAGFKATVLSAELDAGTYQLFILTVSDGGQSSLHPTNQTLVSTGPTVQKTAKNW